MQDIDPADLEDLRSGNFGDVFEGLFGSAGPFGRGGGRPRPGPGEYDAAARSRRPADLNVEVPVTIDFEQAARGTTVEITSPGDREKVSAKVPAGVKDGQRVRLRGRGSRSGSAVGDLILVVGVRPHPYFRRDEANPQTVLLDCPISVWEAILGGKVEVPTLDGPVTLTVPPGSSGGQKLRVRGRGIEKAGGERGDQLVILKVVAPKDLTDADRRLVEELRGRNPVDARSEAAWR